MLQKLQNKSLAFKLCLFILLSTSVVFGVAFGYSFYAWRRDVLKNVELHARSLTLATVYRIETVLQGVQKVPLNLAALLERESLDETGLLNMERVAVETNPEIFGTAIAFEPFDFDPDAYFYCPYCHKAGGGQTAVSFLGDRQYKYFYLDWYQLPKMLRRPVWSEPYYDKGGGDIIMTTFSVPFFRTLGDKKEFRGVVTADINLQWLADIVSSVQIFGSGYAFLISQTGVFITHPRHYLIMRESIFSIAEARHDPELRRIGQMMIDGQEGFRRVTDFISGEKSWLYFASFPSSGWSLGVIFPERELFADVIRLSHVLLGISCVGFLLLIGVIVAISRTITRPLRQLAGTTTEIARGNLDIELPEVRANDEIGVLSRSFANMKQALKEYIAHLEETTAAKERIESELKIARSIQMSFLPRTFPPFPENDRFEIYAELEPAKEVGGDFYEFFLLGEDKLLFAVGDVSGKGVPAALFMAVTKTLMKGMAEPHLELSRLLERVNVELALENDSMMFVTVFCAVLNFRTGELEFTNAGHNPPVLLKKGQPPQWLKLPQGFLLGAFDDTRYGTSRIVLEPGDMVIAYTDGVTEAMNPDKKLYSDQRLLDTVGTVETRSTQAMVRGVMRSVRRFAAGEPQSDDITILAMQYLGDKGADGV